MRIKKYLYQMQHSEETIPILSCPLEDEESYINKIKKNWSEKNEITVTSLFLFGDDPSHQDFLTSKTLPGKI